MAVKYNTSIVTHRLAGLFDPANPKSFKENFIKNSQNFYGSTWSISGLSRATGFPAPDGTKTATRLTDSSSGSYSSMSYTISVPVSNDTYNLSVYIRKTYNTSFRPGINCGFSGGTTVAYSPRINPADGAVSSGTAEDVGDFWRWNFPISNNNTNSTFYLDFFPAAGNLSSDTPSATGSVYVWGFQLTRGSTVKPYTPTNDNYFPGWYLYNISPKRPLNLWGHINAELIKGGDVYPIMNGSTISFSGNGDRALIGGLIFPFDFRTGESTIMVASRYKGGTSGRVVTSDNNLFGNNWLLGHWSSSTQNYYAMGWVSSVGTGPNDTSWRIYGCTQDVVNGQYSLFINGTKVITNSSGGSAGNYGISLGAQGDGGEPSNCEVGILLVYDRILTDAEMLQNFNAIRGRYGL